MLANYGTVCDMRQDVERERRQRRAARLRSNAGGFHKQTRREPRAQVKRELREMRTYGR